MRGRGLRSIAVPSLQLDAPRRYDVATKQLLAQCMGQVYARIMQVQPHIITVAIHDLGEGGVWRCTGDQPQEAALLMCDVRAGRSSETRAELAEALIAVCGDVGGLDQDSVKVEFTQHPGEDMYHRHLGGFNRDWTGDETTP